MSQQAEIVLKMLREEATSLLSTNQQNLQTLVNRLNDFLDNQPTSQTNGHEMPLDEVHYLRDQVSLLLF